MVDRRRPFTYTVGAAAHLLATHALLHAARAPPDQTVSLQRLVILYVFRELAEWVARRGALGAAEERHGSEGERQELGVSIAAQKLPRVTSQLLCKRLPSEIEAWSVERGAERLCCSCGGVSMTAG